MFEVLAIIVFVYGVVFGSYFNVVIGRVPKGESLLNPPSTCPYCGNRLRWYHNIPVISYMFLKGRCGFCAAPISLVYPFVELLTGALAVGGFYAGYVWGGQDVVRSLALSWLVVAALPICVVDFKHYLIPDGVVFPGMGIGLLLSFFSESLPFTTALAGGALSAGGLYLFGALSSRVLKKEALGFGDVKLLGMLGVFMGPSGAYVTLICAAFIGLIGTVGIRIIKGRNFNTPLPFGPYIILTALPVFLWENEIIKGYFDLVMTLAE